MGTIGVSMLILNRGSSQMSEAKFIIQNSAIIEDVLEILKSSPILKDITDAESLNNFLLAASLIPLQSQNLNLTIKISSDKGKVNINALKSSTALQDNFLAYLQNSGLQIQSPQFLLDLLIDNMSGYPQSGYKTQIFNDLPQLFRAKIANMDHLNIILDYYIKIQHDDSVKRVDWEKLVRFDELDIKSLDVNYASTESWMLILPNLDIMRAQELNANGGLYINQDEFRNISGISDIELASIQNLFTDNNSSSGLYYNPQVFIELEIDKNSQDSYISFNYDLTTKKGLNFEFHI
jgi:hypothetical protein